MTNRERLLAIIDGRSPDRIPWLPRLQIWYDGNRRSGTLPAEYRNSTLRQVEQDVFAGTAARDAVIWHTEIENLEVRTHKVSRMETVTEYVTPVGTVTTGRRGTERLRQNAIQDAEVAFMLKGRDDYPVVEYIVEHTRYRPAYEEYELYEKQTGDDGYPIVNCGDCPFHHWMRALVGYDQAFFHLNDYPSRVERLVRLLEDCYRDTVWRHMLDSPARLLIHGHHLSSQMTPPPLFDKYIHPYIRELTSAVGDRGKVIAMHGDNDTRQILSNIEKAGFGMVECFVTQPMVETTLAEARQAWGDRVIIWGGVPSSILEDPFTDAQFERFMDDLFLAIGPGDAFILGISDNAMPGSKIERIKRITQLVEERGRCPLKQEE